MSVFWGGWRRRDPEGYACRIGALWSRLFLRDRWAMVAFGQVWVKNPLTWRAYCRDVWWRAHEHHHVAQLRGRFKGSNLRYLGAFVWQYVRYGSHERAPLEVEANEAATKYVSSLDPDRSRDA